MGAAMLRHKLLDLFRFFAALSVGFYHLVLKVFPEHDPLIEIFKYGMWGVVVFFVISGFVILKSTLGKKPIEFVRRRMFRLYPAYWISIAYVLTVLFVLDEHIDINLLLVNATMLQEFIGFDHVNGVYWTLSFELLFYFYILLFIVYMKTPIDIFIIGWASLILVAKYFDASIFLKILLGNYAAFFLMGMSLYLVYTKKHIRSYLALLISACLGLESVIFFIGDYSAYLQREFSILGVVCYLILVLLLGLLFRGANSSTIQYLGRISYPLYLVHSPSIWFIAEYYQGVVSFILCVFLVLVSSVLVLYLEEAFRNKFINK